MHNRYEAKPCFGDCWGDGPDEFGHYHAIDEQMIDAFTAVLDLDQRMREQYPELNVPTIGPVEFEAAS